MASRLLRCSRPPRTRPPASRTNIALYHDYVRYATPGGAARIPLNSPKVIGVSVSRGERDYQEDFHSFATLSLNPDELRLTVQKHLSIDWDPHDIPKALARQAVFVGIYDGHGGSTASQFCRQELHGLFESCNKSQIPEMYAWIRELGGYFRRFKGGALAPWIPPSFDPEELDLHARATLAFFEVDRHLESEPVAKSSGCTASVAIMHSLDIPTEPFFASEKLALTVAHVGDTRILLCAVDHGRVHPMTENHRAEGRTESIRLRSMMGTGLMADSFGDTRWMGALQNTRSLGDLKWKRFGVTAEPDVRTKLLEGRSWAFMVFVSDGITSVVSDQEIVDLARDALDPKRAADRILAYAEEMGSGDNMTAIVVPLAGWGHVTGPDSTKSLREYRQTQMSELVFVIRPARRDADADDHW
ncbi:protein serine/threonine phosphatase 2C [Auriscalpium vulgare]|uniref:Protein serine/threonine phosphatase 2C n=1 Tax=Auriscalpium vulgare TaxID=40419 RepID=A0ACB8S6Y9_9AGAM|nr:protein serine/threonine phosphatase 2C [Auriscalpium vulgare]